MVQGIQVSVYLTAEQKKVVEQVAARYHMEFGEAVKSLIVKKMVEFEQLVRGGS